MPRAKTGRKDGILHGTAPMSWRSEDADVLAVEDIRKVTFKTSL